MSIPVYLEQSGDLLSHWYIRDITTQEILHMEPSGRGWTLEACKDLGYQVEYEVWPHRMPANQMNPLLQAQIDSGELIVRYKDDEQTCACGATIGSLREFFGHDYMEDHITACEKCGGELHSDDGGSTCVSCGWYSWVDLEGNIEEGNKKTGERRTVRDVSGERDAFLEGYAFLVG